MMEKNIKEKWKEKEVLDLVQEKKISLRKGASLLGLTYREFLKLLDKHKVPTFDYEEGWLESEITSLVEEQITPIEVREAIPQSGAFDTALQTVTEILEKSIHDANPAANFQILKAQIKQLATKTEGQPILRRQMTALLATAIRRINPVELNREQLRVLQEIVKQLKGKVEDFEEIIACEKLLEQVNIDVLPNLGYGAEVWARLVKDEDFFGNVDSDTALTGHQ